MRQTVISMGRQLAHRGPDSSDAWFDSEAGIALAHRRLAVVELSSAGGQPMRSKSGRYIISFNGEIYNHHRIRNTLDQEANADWRGGSDTETFLELIDRRGLESALSQSVGMFAFALWDTEERRLYLVRDRLGEKPLYYGWAGTSLVFASELKALSAHPNWSGRIDRNALCLFFRYNYVPAPFTIYKDVWKLAPGCFVSFTMQDVIARRKPELKTYWSLQKVAATASLSKRDEDESAAIDRLDELLTDAISLQRQADVPTGLFLSGGIDSSLIAAIMREQSSQQVRSFTIGFDERDYDESCYAKAMAQWLQTDHTELRVTSQEARDVIPALPNIYDEPFADSSQIPTYLVAKLARSQVTVALSGDGGDELFGGYNRYMFQRGANKWLLKLPLGIRRTIGRIVGGSSPRSLDALLRPLGALLKDFQAPLASEKAYKAAQMLDAPNEKEIYRRLVSQCWAPSELVVGASEPPTLLDSLIADSNPTLPAEQWMMSADALMYLPDDILVKVDRAAMAASLETRAPFLDHRVVEFALSLPLALKIRDRSGKWILRQLLYKRAPRQLIDRPKMGFALPIDSWLRGPLRDWAESLISPDRLKRDGFLTPQPVLEKWHAHLSGNRNLQSQLWAILMFQSWLENVSG